MPALSRILNWGHRLPWCRAQRRLDNDTAVFASIWGIFAGSEEDSSSSLPGIVRMISAGQAGVRRLLETLAWLSVGLFILNLAPIPALDGGRALFC
ncbi:MAG: site-2 protease family protein [Myxococcota bacterium]